jgi:hypothetical protein
MLMKCPADEMTWLVDEMPYWWNVQKEVPIRRDDKLINTRVNKKTLSCIQCFYFIYSSNKQRQFIKSCVIHDNNNYFLSFVHFIIFIQSLFKYHIAIFEIALSLRADRIEMKQSFWVLSFIYSTSFSEGGFVSTAFIMHLSLWFPDRQLCRMKDNNEGLEMDSWIYDLKPALSFLGTTFKRELYQFVQYYHNVIYFVTREQYIG